MKTATLCFLLKRNEYGDVEEVCLAKKKRGFAEGKWNGMGGKVEDGETIDEAMVREVNEEVGVVVRNFAKMAELTFSFNDKGEWDQIVHTFICEEWYGEPSESDEMSPQWFRITDIPYDQMWDDDKYWLPKVLEGSRIKATFTFDGEQTLLDQLVEIVNDDES
jgi:mutator protein MutT